MTSLKATVVYAYIKRGGRWIEFTGRPLFTNSNLKKKQLNIKLVGRTLLDRTEINIGLLIAVLKVMSYNL